MRQPSRRWFLIWMVPVAALALASGIWFGYGHVFAAAPTEKPAQSSEAGDGLPAAPEAFTPTNTRTSTPTPTRTNTATATPTCPQNYTITEISSGTAVSGTTFLSGSDCDDCPALLNL